MRRSAEILSLSLLAVSLGSWLAAQRAFAVHSDAVALGWMIVGLLGIHAAARLRPGVGEQVARR